MGSRTYAIHNGKSGRSAPLTARWSDRIREREEKVAHITVPWARAMSDRKASEYLPDMMSVRSSSGNLQSATYCPRPTVRNTKVPLVPAPSGSRKKTPEDFTVRYGWNSPFSRTVQWKHRPSGSTSGSGWLLYSFSKSPQRLRTGWRGPHESSERKGEPSKPPLPHVELGSPRQKRAVPAPHYRRARRRPQLLGRVGRLPRRFAPLLLFARRRGRGVGPVRSIPVGGVSSSRG